jgi:hypothetical protein
MRRNSVFRTLATMLALWLPLVAGEPGLLHPCPMHGAGRAVAAAIRGEVPAAQAASLHGHHAANHQAPSHSHHDCTCIDCSTVATAAFIAPSAPAAEFTVAEYAVARSVPSVESLARPAPEYSRPYTTGPPRA